MLYYLSLAGCPPFDMSLPCPGGEGKKNDANGCPTNECGEQDAYMQRVCVWNSDACFKN